MQPMQWLFDIILEMVAAAGFIKIPDVELYLKGMIVMWAGNYASIPEGWAICDGTNGTPNLRTRFIQASLNSGHVGFTGGANTHLHPFTGDGHSHTIIPDGVMAAGDGFYHQSTTNPATGHTDGAPNIPLYYVLAFIMKL